MSVHPQLAQQPAHRLRRSIFTIAFVAIVALAGINLLPGQAVRAQNGTNPTLPNVGMTLYLPIVFHQPMDDGGMFDPR